MTRRIFPGFAGAIVLMMMIAPQAAAQSAAQAATQATQEVVAEIRVHGNYATPDAEVIAIAGVTVGQPVGESLAREMEDRLRRSGRFDEVEVRKRYRSLTDTSSVALVIVVREFPTGDDQPPELNPVKRALGDTMFLPVLDYVDGYGFTYGARASWMDLPATRGRVSVPLTWGGTKQAAVEIDQPLGGGVFDRLTGALSVWKRESPFYRVDDSRREARLGLERRLSPSLRAGLRGGVSHVAFGVINERLGTFGADVTLDTRADPVFPRNAVFASAGWEHLMPQSGDGVNRYRVEGRGYVGLIGQTVLLVRGQYARADGRLPLYERLLLGGASTLRGYRAGTWSGDTVATASVELRAPLNSPLSFSRAGVSVFADAGKAYDFGQRFGDTRARYGGGAGLFLLVSVFQLNLDIAVREGGGVRAHFSSGFQF